MCACAHTQRDRAEELRNLVGRAVLELSRYFACATGGLAGSCHTSGETQQKEVLAQKAMIREESL